MGSIKNIIFDFGGVIIPVDQMAYASGMIDLGCRDIAGLHEKFLQQEVYVRFEKGEMSPGEFRSWLRTGLDNHVTNDQLDQVWNSMLGKIQPQRVWFLESLKKAYRTFLLSNTNIIHYNYYNDLFCKTFGYHSLGNLFEKAYYSYRIGLYKPDPVIFEYVLEDSGLDPDETIFIDDNLQNVKAAEECGITALQLTDIESLDDLIFSATKAQRH